MPCARAVDKNSPGYEVGTKLDMLFRIVKSVEIVIISAKTAVWS